MLSERVWTATQDPAAVALQMRAAYKVCPTCKAEDTNGKYITQIFYLDEYVDRVYMANEILPQVFIKGPRSVLWVGVQPYTLRYE